jgi:hypothetical protein
MSSDYQFSHGIFNFLVPETIDEGVQHRDHHSVEHRHHFVLVSRVSGPGHHIDECNGPIEQDDSSEMGGAGRKSLVTALSGVHLQD